MIDAKAILQILLIYLITPDIFSMHNSLPFNDPPLQSSGRVYSSNGEFIFIHTDRDEYVAGEYLWYAAYLIDMQKKSSNTTSNIIYIELLNNNNTPIVQKYINIVNGAGHGAFMIPDTLGTGSYIIRAYTSLMKNFPPEQCFMKAINIYNTFGTRKFTPVSIKGKALPPGLLTSGSLYLKGNSNISDAQGSDSPSINLSGNKIRVETKDIVGQREKTVIDITFDTAFNSTLKKTNLSISVSPWTGSEGSPDICDYLTKIGSDTSQRMSERNVTPDLRYQSEENGRLIYGRIISRNLEDSSDNKTVILSVPGKGAFFQYAITDREGNFSFKINDDEFTKDLIFQVAGNPENDLIRISSPFRDNYAEVKKISDSIYSEIPSYIEDWCVNYQVGRVYETKAAGDPVIRKNIQKDFYRFYGVPDFELIMADYVLLPTMQEVFFELVPGVMMRTGRTRYGITVFNPRDNKPYDTDATLMVDGIIINDPSIIVEMNPENVERVDVVSTEYMVGGYHFYGIVNVVTKEGNFNLSLPQNAIKLPFMDQEPEMVFLSPEHSSPETEAARIPDYRNTLYWNPDIKTDDKGKARIEFWASDYISDYEIKIQGITDDGIPISFKKLIRVQ